ncbi:helix-turn-helix transcriptional regulator [Erwinia endophytica]|uniref:helix-turn-helix transcriptional regulator n=1 Tax=Erwinia endophytica TaxID=1563158 RepID=UPI001265EA8F|nr:helix-turn-helix transcriptional regulator [Erwinia endophytica]KAB8312328.1 helix-turn-helix transcriptional regulator [Erwinia endophytica]
MKSEAGDFLRSDWRHVGVIDPCNYGRQGLVMALRSPPGISQGQHSVQGYDGVEDALSHSWGGQSDRCLAQERTAESRDILVVRLPPNPLEGLALLLQLGALTEAALSGIMLTVLSRFSAGEVRRVLRRAGVENPLWVMDDRLPVMTLCSAVAGSENDSGEGAFPSTGFQPRLTNKEREVLVSSLLGISVQEQAYQRTLNISTVYGQRQSALYKLGVATLPGLLELFDAHRPALTGSGCGRAEGRYASAG